MASVFGVKHLNQAKQSSLFIAPLHLGNVETDDVN